MLVVPKQHKEQPWKMTDAEILATWELVKKYQKLLSEKVGNGCDVREKYRPFLAESELKVNHLHWHSIPRTNQDKIYTKCQIGEKEIFERLGDGELPRLRRVLLK